MWRVLAKRCRSLCHLLLLCLGQRSTVHVQLRRLLLLRSCLLLRRLLLRRLLLLLLLRLVGHRATVHVQLRGLLLLLLLLGLGDWTAVGVQLRRLVQRGLV